MAKKVYKKTTREEWARMRENHRRLEELIERALRRLGMTRNEVRARLGLPSP